MKQYHKEEAMARLIADSKDRTSIRQFLSIIADPMKRESLPDGQLMYTVTGQIAPPNVTCENSVAIGRTVTTDLKSGWP